VLNELEGEGRVLFRYVGSAVVDAPANPNGALRDIAGICSASGRIAGLMPHPEHAIDPLTGPTDDGLGFFLSVVDFLEGARVA
jgi:phosphoribosylformylglycinamidine synthase